METAVVHVAGSKKLFIAVWAALLGLTGMEVLLAYQHLEIRMMLTLLMGLSIVKGIIDAHRGIIREVGVPGNGARFEILLPAKEKEECHEPNLGHR